MWWFSRVQFFVSALCIHLMASSRLCGVFAVERHPQASDVRSANETAFVRDGYLRSLVTTGFGGRRDRLLGNIIHSEVIFIISFYYWRLLYLRQYGTNNYGEFLPDCSWSSTTEFELWCRWHFGRTQLSSLSTIGVERKHLLNMNGYYELAYYKWICSAFCNFLTTSNIIAISRIGNAGIVTAPFLIWIILNTYSPLDVSWLFASKWILSAVTIKLDRHMYHAALISLLCRCKWTGNYKVHEWKRK